MSFARLLLAASALIFAAACEVNVNKEGASNETNGAAQQAQASGDGEMGNPQAIARARELALASGAEAERAQLRSQARTSLRGLRFLVDISDRQLRIFQGDRLVRTHPVAVGSEDWPTPTGSWQFHRVDLNPEWIPPNEEWAEDEERKAPGDADNPMGRARLVYRMPNTVHGTDDLNSLGNAVSHGSIRVANDVALNLAEMLLKAGNAWEGPEWFRRMTQNRTTEYQIDLPERVPIEVQE